MFAYLARVGIVLPSRPAHCARVVAEAVDQVRGGGKLLDALPSDVEGEVMVTK